VHHQDRAAVPPTPHESDSYFFRAVEAGASGYRLKRAAGEDLINAVRGLTNREIAEKLVVSASTMQTHRTHILQKQGLETTVDIVRQAIRNGFIEA
jgi:DNA-binding NarL/FixJ family response regulator